VSAYSAALLEAETIEAATVGCCLLSAGPFRGARSLDALVAIAVQTLKRRAYSTLQEVWLIAHSDEEAKMLKAVADLYSRRGREGLEEELKHVVEQHFSSDNSPRGGGRGNSERQHDSQLYLVDP
jgi:hypothetical protein